MANRTDRHPTSGSGGSRRAGDGIKGGTRKGQIFTRGPPETAGSFPVQERQKPFRGMVFFAAVVKGAGEVCSLKIEERYQIESATD